MSKSVYDHNHAYQRVGRNGKMFRCVRPRCTHSVSTKLLAGRTGACILCNVQLEITEEDTKKRDIICKNCGSPKKLEGEDPMDILKAALL